MATELEAMASAVKGEVQAPYGAIFFIAVRYCLRGLDRRHNPGAGDRQSLVNAFRPSICLASRGLVLPRILHIVRAGSSGSR